MTTLNRTTRGLRDVCMPGNDRFDLAGLLAGIFRFADRSGMAQMTAGKERHHAEVEKWYLVIPRHQKMKLYRNDLVLR